MAGARRYLLSLLHIVGYWYVSPICAEDPGISIGVYYFPGWAPSAAMGRERPWERIKPYPHLEPLLGWYDEREQGVAATHIAWLGDYGIDFVVFDWYWLPASGVHLSHAITNFQTVGTGNVRIAILWANHFGAPESREDFDSIVEYWIEHYFKDPAWYHLDGKPVVFVFSPPALERDAAAFGATSKQLLTAARYQAKEAGLSGIFFIGCTQARADLVQAFIPEAGYDAISGYNYHHGLSGKLEPRTPSHSFEELADGYRETWSWIIANTSLPYLIPVTAGWDRTPRGGSTDPLHDNSRSDPSSFYSHVLAAKQLALAHPHKTRSTILACCWNEYGEGSVIEPTVRYGFSYLNLLRKLKSATP